MATTTMATMATMMNAKCMNKNTKQAKPFSLLSIQNLPKGLNLTNQATKINMTSTAIAGAVFTTLSKTDPAFAVQQIAEIAEGDNRGLALLLPIIPAIAWVLFNILQPALNQLNRMRETKGVIVGIGLGGGLLASSGFVSTPHASATINDVATVAAEAAGGDSRGQLLLIVVTPAILWVLYNILQPALNQINRMRSE